MARINISWPGAKSLAATFIDRHARPAGAGRRNMAVLIQLRWIAAAGQIVTILLVHFGMGIMLPLAPMLLVPMAAVVLNLISSAVLKDRRGVANGEIFFALIFDVTSLTIQLYLSGGATNPFISLYLLQVVLAATLLDIVSTWAIVVITSLCAGMLIVSYRPLTLPPGARVGLFDLYILGAWVALAMIAVLLVLFTTRISRNLRARDARLADMRQRAAEEEHIVRMGLLASGAAHELGTPLSSLAVILSDWKRMPGIAADPDLMDDIEDMQAEVARCKAIVTGILLSSGSARGEAPTITRLDAFLNAIVNDRRAAHWGTNIEFEGRIPTGISVVADPALQQVIGNVIDNAVDVSPEDVFVSAAVEQEMVQIAVRDVGEGFQPAILANFGKPYQSTKRRLGGGLGLFLLVNVMRQLGGNATATNHPDGGAVVTLTLPLSALTIEGKARDDD
jgi:two-component system sensor histidine kinase RegB